MELSELSSTKQEIYALVSSTANPPSLLFAIYASPRLVEQRLLWENLETVASLHSLPWVIAGNFNEVLMNGDKLGGNAISISRALRFQECLNMCNMIDIGFAGPRFTWSNHRSLAQLVQERIDRVFVNPVWNNLHPEAAVLHLEKTHSDHCPIKLLFNRTQDTSTPRPFRFQPMWLSHPSFPSVVCDAWSSPSTLQQAVMSFSEKARIWNRSHFGNLFQRKNRVLARLKSIQVSLAASPNTRLINLEKMLRSEFAKVAKLEEEFWAMKSRILWLVEGDRNTSFYHTAALVHRRRNRIVCMQDRMGNWIDGNREISEFIREGFLDLFTSGLTVSTLAEWKPPCWYTRINEVDAVNIDRLVTDAKIKASLWALKPFKVPGPDGLHASFFQQFWLLVGESVKKEIKLIFMSRVVLEYLNKTLITLIPKNRNPESLNNYCPISLCNTIYKMVTKIIVARIRPLPPDLISPLQSAFVPGRQGVDNAIIVQELIHSMERKKGRGGVMAI